MIPLSVIIDISFLFFLSLILYQPSSQVLSMNWKKVLFLLAISTGLSALVHANNLSKPNTLVNHGDSLKVTQKITIEGLIFFRFPKASPASDKIISKEENL